MGDMPGVNWWAAADPAELLRTRLSQLEMKSPIIIARILGLSIIVKYLFKNLSIKDIEERVYKILGMKGLAIISPYPEVKFDIDSTEHVEIAKKFLKK